MQSTESTPPEPFLRRITDRSAIAFGLGLAIAGAAFSITLTISDREMAQERDHTYYAWMASVKTDCAKAGLDLRELPSGD